MLNRLSAFLHRLRRDRSGLAAVEFAVICPVMLISLMGAVEVSNGMAADRRVTLVTSTIADLTSQDSSVTNAEMADIFAAGAAVMHPMDATPLKMRISSIVADLNGVTRVAWSSGYNGMPARAAGATIAIPDDMVSPGGSVIFAEVEYLYTSTIGEFLTDGVTIKDQFYLRPRRVLTIGRVSS